MLAKMWTASVELSPGLNSGCRASEHHLGLRKEGLFDESCAAKRCHVALEGRCRSSVSCFRAPSAQFMQVSAGHGRSRFGEAASRVVA